MEEFPHQQEEVMLLLERINESQRLASARLKEASNAASVSGKKKRRSLDVIDDTELLRQNGHKKRRKSKK